MTTQINKAPEIRIPIPEEGTDLKQYFQGLAPHVFKDAIDLDVVAMADRAVLDEIEIDNVTLDGEHIEVEYTIRFSAYLGCKDQNWDATESNSVCGCQQSNAWSFARHIPCEPRTTAEEF